MGEVGGIGEGGGRWRCRAVREVRAVQLAARVGQSGVWRLDAVAAGGNGSLGRRGEASARRWCLRGVFDCGLMRGGRTTFVPKT